MLLHHVVPVSHLALAAWLTDAASLAVAWAVWIAHSRPLAVMMALTSVPLTAAAALLTVACYVKSLARLVRLANAGPLPITEDRAPGVVLLRSGRR